MARQEIYPFVPGKYGIPFHELTTPFEGPIRGGSGADLYIVLGDREISVDAWDPNGTLYADLDAKNRLHLTLQSIGLQTLQRHPDLFATKFVTFTFNYFAQRGIDIRHFQAKWLDDSYNHDQFMNTYSFTHDLIQSARSTWTAKVMEQQGLTKISGVHIGKTRIRANFSRGELVLNKIS